MESVREDHLPPPWGCGRLVVPLAHAVLGGPGRGGVCERSRRAEPALWRLASRGVPFLRPSMPRPSPPLVASPEARSSFRAVTRAWCAWRGKDGLLVGPQP